MCVCSTELPCPQELLDFKQNSRQPSDCSSCFGVGFCLIDSIRSNVKRLLNFDVLCIWILMKTLRVANAYLVNRINSVFNLSSHLYLSHPTSFVSFNGSAILNVLSVSFNAANFPEPRFV